MVFRNSLAAILVLTVMAGLACADCPSSDLRVELTLRKYVFEIGEKVEYQLRITNVSGKEVSIEQRSWPNAGHRIKVRDVGGNGVPIKHPLTGIVGMGAFIQELAHLQSIELKYPINPYAVLTRPGTYTATAHVGSPSGRRAPLQARRCWRREPGALTPR